MKAIPFNEKRLRIVGDFKSTTYYIVEYVKIFISSISYPAK